MGEFTEQIRQVTGFNPTPIQLEQFQQYLTLLLDWNQHLNLTALCEPDVVWERLILNSLTCASVIGQPQGHPSLIDIGTGAGVPGLLLKILYPQIQVTLVDSVAKKTRFLQEAVSELRLSGVDIVCERAEILGHKTNYRAMYDWAVARAVAKVRILAEYLLPFCCLGGHMVALKGEQAAKELAAAKIALHTLGGGEPSLLEILMPNELEATHLVVVEKKRNTPLRYPRRTGVPRKRPL